MDFTAYETFLENLNSITCGVSYLIQKVNDNPGKHFVWSPVAPDIVEEGSLSCVRWRIGYTNTEPILPAILEHLDCDNYIVELVCMNSDGKSVYLLSIGY